MNDFPQVRDAGRANHMIRRIAGLALFPLLLTGCFESAPPAPNPYTGARYAPLREDVRNICLFNQYGATADQWYAAVHRFIRDQRVFEDKYGGIAPSWSDLSGWFC